MCKMPACALAVTLIVAALAAASGPAGPTAPPTSIRTLTAAPAATAAVAGPTVIHVDQTATLGADNGTSWADAYLDLQDALDDALALGSAAEIRVAEGVYLPDRGTGDRTHSFTLVDDVKVLGGFPSGGAAPSGRDPASNVTILSGDLAGDDSGVGCAGANENALNVVTADAVSATAWIDGFVITGGNPAQDMLCEEGGGIFVEDASPTVTNCNIVNNCACTQGGGVFVWDGSGSSAPTFINCVFNGNSAPEGGAMYIASGDVTMINCTIAQNHAGSFTGGVIADGSDVTLDMTNCILWFNDTNGVLTQTAQIVAGPGSTVTMDYCIVQGWLGTLPGTGSNGDDPLFANPDGDDRLAGSLDDNLRLTCGSPGIDSGDNTVIPADACDLDGDGDTVEPLPVDLDHGNRFVNNIAPDTGVGTPPIVDRGAYELLADLSSPCIGDTNGDFEVNVDDLVEVIVQWECVAPPACSADVFTDCVVNVNDLVQVIVNWGACPVENDECEDKITVDLGPTVFHNQSATTNGADPAFTCGTNPGNDVWFNYTSPCAATLTVDTCGSDFDTVLAVYAGAVCPPVMLLACNDDAGGGTGCAGTSQSSVSVPVTAGQSVKIRVGGVNGDQGVGTLTLALTDTDNDECECATLIAPGQTLSVDTTGSTFDFSQIQCLPANDFNGGSVFLRCVGTGNQFLLELCGDPIFSFDSRLNVYCGPCTDLECVAGEPVDTSFCDPFTEQLEWCTAPGAEYIIMIHGNAAEGVVDATLTELGGCGAPPCE